MQASILQKCRQLRNKQKVRANLKNLCKDERRKARNQPARMSEKEEERKDKQESKEEWMQKSKQAI